MNLENEGVEMEMIEERSKKRRRKYWVEIGNRRKGNRNSKKGCNMKEELEEAQGKMRAVYEELIGQNGEQSKQEKISGNWKRKMRRRNRESRKE